MKVFKRISEQIDLHIRKLCNCLSPMQKIVLTVVLFAMFFLASLYVIVFTAYQVGKQDGKLIQIEHVHPAPMMKQDKNLHYEME